MFLDFLCKDLFHLWETPSVPARNAGGEKRFKMNRRKELKKKAKRKK
jgi:hypothetical protein